MQIDWSKVRVYIKPGATDMRKQYNGLAHMVTEVMGKEYPSNKPHLYKPTKLCISSR